MADSSGLGSSSASSSTRPSLDINGEMHDPAYLSALRTLQAEIGARAASSSSSSSRLNGSNKGDRRRPSSSGGYHAPARPSNLGPGNVNDEDSSEDEGDSDIEDHDSYRALFNEGNRVDSRSQSLSSPSRSPLIHNARLVPSSSTSSTAITPPITPPPPAAPSSSSSSSRHCSVSDGTTSPKKDKTRRASWAARRKESVSRSSTPRMQEEERRKKDQEWGFTGLVDLERAQREARQSLDAAYAGDEADMNCNKTSSAIQRKGSKGSNSNSSSPGEGGSCPIKSLGLSSFCSGSASTLRSRSSSRTTEPNDSLSLTTIVSGQPLKDDDSFTSSEPTTSTIKKCPLTAQLEEQQEDADFIVGPSKYKQSKEVLKQKSQDWSDVSTQSRDLRRKVETLALGVRFGAFKAKRRLERGMHA